jgi:hypothetical protein
MSVQAYPLIVMAIDATAVTVDSAQLGGILSDTYVTHVVPNYACFYPKVR